MRLKIREIDVREDERGIFAEILKNDGLKERIKEVLLVVSRPGVIRGNHYHKKKAEWLCLLKGKGKFLYVDNETGARKEFVIDNKPTIIETPLNVAHAVKNVGDEDLYLLEISDHLYSEDPDISKREIM
ncbi:MAG: WxcM-like domain-containing protein [Candidatus Micrarchaeaceae archaeon]|jgi:UDP-2-acetamido-2,6-beta-L-arabino-hexul-4-ose reductase|nr:hypothetical protein [Candidatus Micrarchaeota archaeon]HII09598.1 hypothetical protein [Candidatus Micrarchaeota archaeon]